MSLSYRCIFRMKIQSGLQLQAKVVCLFNIWPSPLPMCRACNVISNILVFLSTSLLPWRSHQNQHSAGIKSYVLNTTEIIEHTRTDSHFPYSMKILINFCFFFNNEYAIILFTFLLFVLPNKLELQWLDSCTQIET